MFEGVAKLCQRQIYSWLSSKCGLPVCIVGLLIAIISAFQFGEVSLSFYLKHTTFQCKADVQPMSSAGTCGARNQDYC